MIDLAITHQNGCHNRPPFVDSHEVQDGWIKDSEPTPYGVLATRHPVMKMVPFRNSPDCQYTHTELGRVDRGCLGCGHRSQPL